MTGIKLLVLPHICYYVTLNSALRATFNSNTPVAQQSSLHSYSHSNLMTNKMDKRPTHFECNFHLIINIIFLNDTRASKCSYCFYLRLCFATFLLKTLVFCWPSLHHNYGSNSVGYAVNQIF